MCLNNPIRQRKDIHKKRYYFSNFTYPGLNNFRVYFDKTFTNYGSVDEYEREAQPFLHSKSKNCD